MPTSVPDDVSREDLEELESSFQIAHDYKYMIADEMSISFLTSDSEDKVVVVHVMRHQFWPAPDGKSHTTVPISAGIGSIEMSWAQAKKLRVLLDQMLESENGE